MANRNSKDFPKTLIEFGYEFNDDGKLQKIETKEPFEFNVFDTQQENQKHYEALGETLTDVVYDLLEKKTLLHKIYLPTDVPKEEATFVFCSQKELINPKKLLVIIHGSGVVRAGQWARSIIINHSLGAGTVIPYIDRATELGYEVLITNTNDNHRNNKEIKGSESPTKHARTVWSSIIQPANPEAIAIVAHSYGGVVVTDLADKFSADFKKKVFAIGFTDSVHSSHKLPPYLLKIGKNYVTSEKPVNTLVKSSDSDFPRVSAGHIKHEMTSHACKDHLFQFVEELYEKKFIDSANSNSKKQKTDL